MDSSSDAGSGGFHLMSAYNILPVGAVAVVFTILCWRRLKNEGGTGVLSFNLKRNALMLLTAANSEACLFFAVPIAAFVASSNAGVAAIIFVVEACVTSILCAMHVRGVAPWDGRKWEERVRTSKMSTAALQVWFALSFLGGWVARWFIVDAYIHDRDVSQDANVAVNTNFSMAVLATVVTGFVQTVLLFVWCCWYTFWDRTQYERFICPACHGSALNNCKECQMGIVMHHA